MRILITGGFGFVGGRLASHLQQAGHQIILGSRKDIGSPDWLPQAKVVQINWNEDGALEHICSGIDIVIHAAGMNVQDCVADPVAALEFNGLATARLLAAATRVAVQRFIYLSTAHVYSSPLVGTITEDACPRNLHPYATSHLAGEYAVLSASQRGRIEGIVLRLSNSFGVPMHKEVNCWMLLVNDLCRQAVETGKIVLHSSGLQHRDFIALRGVCRTIENLAYCESTSLVHRVFNMGSGTSKSVLEMAQFIRHRCKVVLGFEPQLWLPDPVAGERYDSLKYSPDRLLKAGCYVDESNNDEIDGLLVFCRISFNFASE